MSLDYRILKNGKLIPATVEEYAAWFSTDERFIGNYRHADTTISTICLGIDHGWGSSKPMYFESLAFGGIFGEERMQRYSTLEEAEAGHQQLVLEYQRSLPLEFGPDIYPTNRLNHIDNS